MNCLATLNVPLSPAASGFPRGSRGMVLKETVLDYRKLFDLAGKTAVVLGAASGIGKSSAEALAALGAEVICADRAKEGAEATAATIRAQGGSADSAACDAASAADVAALAATVTGKFPR